MALKLDEGHLLCRGRGDPSFTESISTAYRAAERQKEMTADSRRKVDCSSTSSDHFGELSKQ